MSLLSIEFAAFFMLLFPAYWALRPWPGAQNALLLAASLFMLWLANPYFAAALLVFATGVFGVARGIAQSRHEKAKKRWLGAGAALIAANLVFFKYHDFFAAHFPAPLQEPVAALIFPLGLSWYSFQAIAYLDWLRQRPASLALKWHELVLHLVFFPTVTSGPIFRAGLQKSVEGLHAGAAIQIQTRRPRRLLNPALAVCLILLGITKKWFLAGALAEQLVDPVFDNPMQHAPLTVLTAIYGYTAQLFFDFSGYSDLVIGLAMLLGFHIPLNFMQPLAAHNLREFWNRWHISLSTWIRDYIYIPLGGSRHGFARTQLNLLLALGLSGAWHGQGWNFLLWGLAHGAGLVLLNAGDALAGRRNALAGTAAGRFAGRLATAHFVCLAFVVFRVTDAESLAAVWQALAAPDTPWATLPPPRALAWLALLAAAWLLCRPLAAAFAACVALMQRLPVLAWALPASALMGLLIIVAPPGVPGFIYAGF